MPVRRYDTEYLTKKIAELMDEAVSRDSVRLRYNPWRRYSGDFRVGVASTENPWFGLFRSFFLEIPMLGHREVPDDDRVYRRTQSLDEVRLESAVHRVAHLITQLITSTRFPEGTLTYFNPGHDWFVYVLPKLIIVLLRHEGLELEIHEDLLAGLYTVQRRIMLHKEAAANRGGGLRGIRFEFRPQDRVHIEDSLYAAMLRGRPKPLGSV